MSQMRSPHTQCDVSRRARVGGADDLSRGVDDGAVCVFRSTDHYSRDLRWMTRMRWPRICGRREFPPRLPPGVIRLLRRGWPNGPHVTGQKCRA
jgi:hypothetical protein